MANPYLAMDDSALHGGTEDHYGDNYHMNVAPRCAGILIGAVAFIVLLRVSGFKAMIGVGR